jgi:hypothetical protein
MELTSRIAQQDSEIVQAARGFKQGGVTVKSNDPLSFCRKNKDSSRVATLDLSARDSRSRSPFCLPLKKRDPPYACAVRAAICFGRFRMRKRAARCSRFFRV